MRILHVNHLLDPETGGGTSERTFQLVRFLSRAGCECAILTLDIGETETYENQLPDVPVFKLPCLNKRYFIHTTWPWRIKNLISRFDVVHLMGHWTMLNALVALRCIQQGKPYVFCPAGALKPFGRSQWLKKGYDFLIGQKLIRYASRIIAITENEKQEFISSGISEDIIEVIPNGIDPEQYRKPTPPTDFSPEISIVHPYILFLGRLNPIKGPDLLLEAFAGISSQFPDLHLVLAGPDSGSLQSLQRMSSREGLDGRVHFIGYLNGQAKVNALHNATCLVIPSRNEAMSIVVLEAGICGTPVIFTDRCGLEEFAESNAGVLVSATAESIRDGLVFALSNPPEMRERTLRTRNLIAERFLWSIQAEHYQKLYQELLLGKKPS